MGRAISANMRDSHWLGIGGNFNLMNIRDNVRTVTGTEQESLTYKARIPNIPYQFANMFASFFWNDLGAKGNKLTVTYDNNYMHNFPLYSEILGSESEFVVPTQFSHNLTVSYAIKNNRYNFSLECQNFTNEKLYDNFSLQKAGRAFYGKVRVYFGSNNNITTITNLIYSNMKKRNLRLSVFGLCLLGLTTACTDDVTKGGGSNKENGNDTAFVVAATVGEANKLFKSDSLTSGTLSAKHQG